MDDQWHNTGFDESDSLEWIKFPKGVYQTNAIGGTISLVDLGLTRRYYSFRPFSYVTITGNVHSFENIDGTLEAGVDETKQFPNKQKLTD